MIGVAWAMFPGQGGGGQDSPFSFVILLGGMFAIMYFLMIRPQQKQKKDREAMLSAVKTGDEVITNGGLFGVVKGFADDNQRVRLQVAPNVQVEVARSAIGTVVGSTLVKKDRDKDKDKEKEKEAAS
jgi:preprotein translocase subunit YajC